MSLISRAYSALSHAHCNETYCIERPNIHKAVVENMEAVRYQLNTLGKASNSFDELAKQLKERRSK